MKEYKSKYLKPYIRKIKNSDIRRALNSNINTYHDVCMAIDTGRGGYVLVQHGSQRILAYATDKWKLKNMPVPVWRAKKNKSKIYNAWCNETKKWAHTH